jgi:hypothetical protein
MKSQVQVLAGPPVFSQLKGLTRPIRSRSRPAWAAVGPHEPRTLPEQATPGPRSTTRAPPVSPPPSSPGHGRPHAANPAPDDLRAAMPQLGVHRAHTCSQTDGDPAQPCGPWPAMRSNPVRCPSASTTTTRSSPTSPLGPARLLRDALYGDDQAYDRGVDFDRFATPTIRHSPVRLVTNLVSPSPGAAPTGSRWPPPVPSLHDAARHGCW